MAVEMEASIPTEIAPALGISVISIFSCWLMVLKIKTNLLECYVYAGRIGAYFGRIGAYFGRGLISVGRGGAYFGRTGGGAYFGRTGGGAYFGRVLISVGAYPGRKAAKCMVLAQCALPK